MRTLLFGFSVLSLAVVACGSSGSTGSTGGADGGACGTSGSGTIVVTISGLPSGVTGKVNVTQTGGSTQTYGVTTTNAAAAAGDYTVTADIVAQADPIVRTAFKGAVSVSTAKVCAGQTTNIDVTYSQIATSNKLWWGNQNGGSATLGYASANLAASGAPNADIAAATQGALPGEFDHDGNLWVIDGVSKSIKRYAADSLASGGDKTPDIEISSDAFSGGTPGPATLTLDANGYMYVGITYSKSIAVIGPDSLKASGTVTAGATITTPDAPSALAFDNTGNIWVACANDRVLKYSNPRSGPTTPDETIEAQTPSPTVGTLASPLGLAFDSTGNLWVDYDSTFAKLTTADLGGSGDKTVTPAVQIKADVLSLPAQIAFDESGGLWFAYSAGKFAKFSAGQLATSGTIAPQVIIAGPGIGSATSPAFYPSPASSPLASSIK